MKINWKVRAKSPQFWIGLLGVIGSVVLPYFSMTYADLTTWEGVAKLMGDFIQNPFLVGSVIMAALGFVGVLNDPTTKGIKDSERALGYKKPGGGE